MMSAHAAIAVKRFSPLKIPGTLSSERAMLYFSILFKEEIYFKFLSLLYIYEL